MAVVSNPPKGFQVPVGHSCIITRSGVCLIPCELISGTWLRVIVNFPKSKCTVAMPIEPPIHTRVVDDPKSLTKQRLVVCYAFIFRDVILILVLWSAVQNRKSAWRIVCLLQISGIGNESVRKRSEGVSG
jgi:hypothetical protein